MMKKKRQPQSTFWRYFDRILWTLLMLYSLFCSAGGLAFAGMFLLLFGADAALAVMALIWAVCVVGFMLFSWRLFRDFRSHRIEKLKVRQNE